MAALTVALNVVNELQKYLASHAKAEVGLLWNFKDDLKNMGKTLAMLEAVLNDAESRSNQDEAVRLWLADLRVACYDIQDMLADYKQPNGQLGSVSSVKVCFGTLISGVALAHKMKSMRARLKNIAELKNNFELKKDVALDMSIINKNRETISIPESKVFGRDEDHSEVVNMIIGNKTSEQIFVLPIFGMGGLGKTTLAQLIFKDSKLRDSKHFDAWAWAYVSVEFNLCNIGNRIISSIRNSEVNMHNLESISQELKKEVSGKKCLIVLDDVWMVDMDLWAKLISILIVSSKGSTIIVTTRDENIANGIASGTPYPLKPLSENYCLDLFHEKAFKSAEEMNTYPDLVEIGKKIAKKCGGVALVANVLGSMLRSQRDAKFWELHDNLLQLSITTQNIQNLSENRIFSGLLLSYNLMPAVLKPCFAYCSMYPKGHQIDPLKLIQHWISLNFIRYDSSLHNGLTLHDIARSYLNSLISLSFLQKSKTQKGLGEVDTVVMHDLMHDMAHHVAKDHGMKIVSDKGNTQDASKTSNRYISIYGLKEACKLSEIVQLDEKVRAISLYSDEVEVNDTSFTNARRLRVLEAEGHEINLPKKLKQLCYFSASPSHVPKLINLPNLQFLHLASSQFEALPKNIGNSQRLQYPYLYRCYYLTALPKSITNHQKLLHLDLSYCSKLKKLPESFGNLKSLQYLDLSFCQNLATLPDSIVNLQKLLHLDLTWCLELKKLPESFGNLTSLQYLDLSNCRNLETLPDSIINLKKLLHLNLYFCRNLEKLPQSFSNLKTLERLLLYKIDQVQDQLLVQLTSLRHLSVFETLSTSSMKLIRQLTKLETLKLNLDFIIKEEEVYAEEGMKHSCCNIVCLENLNMLERGLTLMGLENVKDPKDALRANLKEKHKVLKVELVWNGDDLEDDDAAAVVLQNLQPSSKLQKLTISGYGGRQWPSWMIGHHMSSLTLRNIKDDNLLQQLGCMPHIVPMPRLDRLSIENIPGLKKIEFGRSLFVFFPLLEGFLIVEMENLEQVSLMNIDVKIPYLVINECPCLRRISLEPSVTTLELVKNGGLLLSPAGTIEASSLEELRIWNCEKLVTLPEYLGKLSSLKRIVIRKCPNIQSLPDSMRQLTQLQQLIIRDCSEDFKQECEDLKSDTWSRIQHIPNVHISALKYLASQAKEEVELLWDFEDDLKNMGKKLAMLEALLNDAEIQSNKDEAVRLWLAERRDACYDMQDMLDPYMLQHK